MDEEQQNKNKRAAKAVGNMAARQAAKWTGKAILKVTVATGGGCLIPLLVLIIILMVAGIISATTLSKKYDYDAIEEAAAEEGVPAQEYLFNEIYSAATGELLFTEQELRAMVFDKKSLKTMFELIYEYNTEQIKKEIKVRFKGVFKVPDGYTYWEWGKITKKWSEITKNRYEFLEKQNPDREDIDRDILYREEETEIEKTIVLDNTWIREKYPIDWQIVYLLCFYDSFDNGNASTDFDEGGKKIRLKKSYIKSVIEDVSSEVLIKEDVSADCIWDIFGEEGHELDAVNYSWGLDTVTQTEIDEEYGAYEDIEEFTSVVEYKGKDYTAKFNGHVPVSRLMGVQTLLTYDTYNEPEEGGTYADDLLSSVYDISKLEMMLEKYGLNRDLNMFLAALKELPGGEDIAKEIEFARREVKEREEQEE